MVVSFKGAHCPQEIILTGVRWYVAYPLSTRHVEELMLERGVHVDHSTINRWVVKYSPLLEEAFHPAQTPGVGQLAHGRDIHSDQRSVVLPVLCRG
jgi:putative transposase